MPAELEASLTELEAVTAELRASDPGELENIAAVLGRRGTAIAATLARFDHQATASQRARLTAVMEAGEQYSERLRLVGAATREQMRELHRLQLVSRALGSSPQQPGAEPGPSMLAVLA